LNNLQVINCDKLLTADIRTLLMTRRCHMFENGLAVILLAKVNSSL